MKNIYLLVLALIITLTSCTSKKSSLLIQRLDSVMNSSSDFSGVVLVADKGTPLFFKSFGYTDYNLQTRLDTGALFELASVSKQFTAMTIMMLKEKGKLNFDDSLKNFIPQLPYTGITIRHLLNNTSGLPDYQAIMDQHWDKSKIAGNAECIEYLSKYHPPVRFAPGSKYEYSNTGYLLLGSVVERVSGMDFIEFVRQRIFQPVGMTNTDIRTLEGKLKLRNFAWGHIYVPEKNQYIPANSFPSSNYTIWLGNRKGPGRISSTASDILKWDQALYTSRLVSRKTLDVAFSPAKLTHDSLSYYGFGWTIGQSALGKVVRHSGDNPGYKTQIIRYIDVNKTIIMLCNNAYAKYDDVLSKIENLVTTGNSVDSNH
jgi:CubicO group peptidase (beta-lactamase class C family)